jgi:hypothetical protein
LKLSHKALSIEKTSKNLTGGWRAAHQHLISEISAWQYAPSDGAGKSWKKLADAGKNRTPRGQPEKLQW